MITFEQFLQNKDNEDYVMKQYQDIITSDPFNFTWLSPEDDLNKVDFNGEKVFAKRDIPRECVSVILAKYFLLSFTFFNGILTTHTNYPIFSEEVFDTDVDFAHIKVFSVYRYTSADPMKLKEFLATHARWKELNYYQSLSGTKIEKTLAFYEYILEQKAFSVNMLERVRLALLRNKLKYSPRGSLSKRDYIRGAMMDI